MLGWPTKINLEKKKWVKMRKSGSLGIKRLNHFGKLAKHHRSN